MTINNKTTSTLNGLRYTRDEKNGYCYKTVEYEIENGKMHSQTTRIGKSEFNKAMQEHDDMEDAKMREAIERLVQDQETEEIRQIQKEMTKKSRRAKKVQVGGMEFTEGGVDTILTPKQVQFIRLLPDTQHWSEGVDSTLWINVLCDELDDKMGPMTIGAMVSTLREKHLLEVTVGSYGEKKAKAFRFTNTGKAVVFKVLGL